MNLQPGDSKEPKRRFKASSVVGRVNLFVADETLAKREFARAAAGIVCTDVRAFLRTRRTKIGSGSEGVVYVYCVPSRLWKGKHPELLGNKHKYLRCRFAIKIDHDCSDFNDKARTTLMLQMVRANNKLAKMDMAAMIYARRKCVVGKHAGRELTRCVTVMEYLRDSETFLAAARRVSKMAASPAKNRLVNRMNADLITAVQTMHTIAPNGHGDLNPQNIMYARETGTIRFIDLNSVSVDRPAFYDYGTFLYYLAPYLVTGEGALGFAEIFFADLWLKIQDAIATELHRFGIVPVRTVVGGPKKMVELASKLDDDLAYFVLFHENASHAAVAAEIKREAKVRNATEMNVLLVNVNSVNKWPPMGDKIRSTARRWVASNVRPVIHGNPARFFVQTHTMFGARLPAHVRPASLRVEWTFLLALMDELAIAAHRASVGGASSPRAAAAASAKKIATQTTLDAVAETKTAETPSLPEKPDAKIDPAPKHWREMKQLLAQAGHLARFIEMKNAGTLPWSEEDKGAPRAFIQSLVKPFFPWDD